MTIRELLLEQCLDPPNGNKLLNSVRRQGRSQKFGGPSQLRLWCPQMINHRLTPPKVEVDGKDNKKQIIMRFNFSFSLISFFAFSFFPFSFFCLYYFVFIIFFLSFFYSFFPVFAFCRPLGPLKVSRGPPLGPPIFMGPVKN